jgi:hypothetical protein
MMAGMNPVNRRTVPTVALTLVIAIGAMALRIATVTWQYLTGRPWRD